MALYLNTNHVLLLALALLVPATSLAQTLGINLGGALSCTADGNSLPGVAGAANATVSFGCGDMMDIAFGATNDKGEYNISATGNQVRPNGTALAMADGCDAIVQLPVPSCNALNHTGTLKASLGVRNIENGVLNLVPALFANAA